MPTACKKQCFIYRWSECSSGGAAGMSPFSFPAMSLWVCFRKANLPIFWSTWWRWGPEDGFFNSMDRFYGPIGQGPESGRTKKNQKMLEGMVFFPALWSNEIGEFRWNTSLNALYNHKPNGGEANQQVLIWMCSWICMDVRHLSLPCYCACDVHWGI